MAVEKPSVSSSHVPVNESDKDTASNDVAEGGRDHALPDVVANGNVRVMVENLWFLVSIWSKGTRKKNQKLTAKGI